MDVSDITSALMAVITAMETLASTDSAPVPEAEGCCVTLDDAHEHGYEHGYNDAMDQALRWLTGEDSA